VQVICHAADERARIGGRIRLKAWMLIMASCVEATESYKPVTSVRLGVVCAET
jgi:hypothetical protein